MRIVGMVAVNLMAVDLVTAALLITATTAGAAAQVRHFDSITKDSFKLQLDQIEKALPSVPTGRPLADPSKPSSPQGHPDGDPLAQTPVDVCRINPQLPQCEGTVGVR